MTSSSKNKFTFHEKFNSSSVESLNLFDTIKHREQELLDMKNMASQAVAENESKLRQMIQELKMNMEHNQLQLEKKEDQIIMLKGKINTMQQNYENTVMDFEKVTIEKAENQLNTIVTRMKREINQKFQLFCNEKEMKMKQISEIELDEKEKKMEAKIKKSLICTYQHELSMMKREMNSIFERIISQKELAHKKCFEDHRFQIQDLKDKHSSYLRFIELEWKKQKNQTQQAFDNQYIKMREHVRENERQALFYKDQYEKIKIQYDQVLQEKDRLTNENMEFQKAQSYLINESVYHKNHNIRSDRRVSDLVQKLHNVEKAFYLKDDEYKIKCKKLEDDLEKIKKDHSMKEFIWKQKKSDYQNEIIKVKKNAQRKFSEYDSLMKKCKQNERRLEEQLLDGKNQISLQTESNNKNDIDNQFNPCQGMNIDSKRKSVKNEQKILASHTCKSSQFDSTHNFELQNMINERNSYKNMATRQTKLIAELQKNCKNLQKELQNHTIDKYNDPTAQSKEIIKEKASSISMQESLKSNSLDLLLKKIIDFEGSHSNEILHKSKNVESKSDRNAVFVEYDEIQDLAANVNTPSVDQVNNLRQENESLLQVIAAMRKDMENAICTHTNENDIEPKEWAYKVSNRNNCEPCPQHDAYTNIQESKTNKVQKDPHLQAQVSDNCLRR